MKRVEIGVIHDEPQPHRLVGQPAQLGAAFPGDNAFDFVADDFWAVVERIAGDRGAGGRQDTFLWL